MLRVFLREASLYRYTLSCAKAPRNDDLYIVSFPKSGATWINFLISNVNIQVSGLNRCVTLYNLHTIIPDIHYSRDIPEATTFPWFRIIKSHSEYNPLYKNIIYLARDPRDAITSYYYFMVAAADYSGTIKDFLRSKCYGIRAWSTHVESWMRHSGPETRIITIRYEDLKSDPTKTIRRIYKTVGYEISDEIVNSAVRLSSFENLKILEKYYGHGGRDVYEKLNFFRKGECGGWRSELDSQDLDYINDIAGGWMAKFGYVH